MDIPPAALDVLLEDAVTRDRTTARRSVLLNILFHERYLTREQLIVRVEGKLGKGCFGDSAWVDTFYRDMQVVKRALSVAGYQPACSRSFHEPGYYLRGQPSISAGISASLDQEWHAINPDTGDIITRYWATYGATCQLTERCSGSVAGLQRCCVP